MCIRDRYAESLAQTTGNLVCITDRDHVVAVAGNGKKEFDGKPLSKQMEDIIESREEMCIRDSGISVSYGRYFHESRENGRVCTG